jgi:hypothetical protein
MPAPKPAPARFVRTYLGTTITCDTREEADAFDSELAKQLEGDEEFLANEVLEYNAIFERHEAAAAKAGVDLFGDRGSYEAFLKELADHFFIDYEDCMVKLTQRGQRVALLITGRNVEIIQ